MKELNSCVVHVVVWISSVHLSATNTNWCDKIGSHVFKKKKKKKKRKLTDAAYLALVQEASDAGVSLCHKGALIQQLGCGSEWSEVNVYLLPSLPLQ